VEELTLAAVEALENDAFVKQQMVVSSSPVSVCSMFGDAM
jgi:hypothetical protein